MVRHSSFVLVCFKQHKIYFLLCSCSVVSIASELQSQQERLCKALSFSPCLSHYLLLLAHLDTKLWHIFNVMLLWLFCGSFPAGIPAVLACLAKAPDLQEVLIRLLPLLHSLPFSLSLSIETSGQFSAEAGGWRPFGHQLHSASHWPGIKTNM